MWARLVGTSVLAAGLLVPPAGATDTSLLQPSSSWDLDYGETQCVALRDYGDAKNPRTLAIRQSPEGDTFEVIVGRTRYGPEFVEEWEGSVDFGSGPIKAWLLHYGAKNKKITIDQFRISAMGMYQAKTAKSVTLRWKQGPDITFALAAMPELLKGLEECTADLKRYWNDGGVADGRIAVPPNGDVRTVFTDQDYPSEAMRRNQEGTAQYFLLVNELGKVAGCHVLRPSGVPVLDTMGCSVIQERAKFSPALDASGKAIRSTYTSPPVSWRIAR